MQNCPSRSAKSNCKPEPVKIMQPQAQSHILHSMPVTTKTRPLTDERTNYMRNCGETERLTLSLATGKIRPATSQYKTQDPTPFPPERSSQPRALTLAAAVALRRLRQEKFFCFFSVARLLSAGVQL